MALATYRILANEYDAEADAIADYEAIHKLYSDLGILDSFDAAVLTRQPDGKVIIVKRVDEQSMSSLKGKQGGSPDSRLELRSRSSRPSHWASQSPAWAWDCLLAQAWAPSSVDMSRAA